MKYLAILKDSFREALDSKVLYVLMGLSAVLTLFLLSISFQPIPAEEALQGATAHGWPNALWTANRVAEVIRRRFGVSFHPEHVRKICKRRLH